MKRLIICIFLAFSLASCDSCNINEECRAKVERSFRCMWTGDCS